MIVGTICEGLVIEFQLQDTPVRTLMVGIWKCHAVVKHLETRLKLQPSENKSSWIRFDSNHPLIPKVQQVEPQVEPGAAPRPSCSIPTSAEESITAAPGSTWASLVKHPGVQLLGSAALPGELKPVEESSWSSSDHWQSHRNKSKCSRVDCCGWQIIQAGLSIVQAMTLEENILCLLSEATSLRFAYAALRPCSQFAYVKLWHGSYFWIVCSAAHIFTTIKVHQLHQPMKLSRSINPPIPPI